MLQLDAASITKRLLLPGNGEVVLVHADQTEHFDPVRNIFLLDEKGQIKWQVEPPVVSHGVVGFSNLYLGKNNELLAYSSNGIEYTIDGATGRILGKELIR